VTAGGEAVVPGAVVVVTVETGGALAVVDAGDAVSGAAVPGDSVDDAAGGAGWVVAFPVGDVEDSDACDVGWEVAVGVGVDAEAVVAVSA
jgi:hypothetical protein